MRRSLNSLFDVYKEKLSSLASAMQNANNKIAQVKSDKAKDEAVDYAKSEIKILDEKISLKVEKGNLISSINLEPDNIKIHANSDIDKALKEAVNGVESSVNIGTIVNGDFSDDLNGYEISENKSHIEEISVKDGVCYIPKSTSTVTADKPYNRWINQRCG